MVYITGDLHGDSQRLAELEEKLNLGGDDVLIVLGDFGFLFFNNRAEQEYLDFLESKVYTLAFIDGNHDNIPALNQYPEDVWNEGKIHRLRKNVLHLCRGQVFTIQGKSYFTMGGAFSPDRARRTEGINWWPEELPSYEEYAEAIRNLIQSNYHVDIVLTHTAPRRILEIMYRQPRRFSLSPPDPKEADLLSFFEYINAKISFDRWFFGHLHIDAEEVWPKYSAVLREVYTIEAERKVPL